MHEVDQIIHFETTTILSGEKAKGLTIIYSSAQGEEKSVNTHTWQVTWKAICKGWPCPNSCSKDSCARGGRGFGCSYRPESAGLLVPGVSSFRSESDLLDTLLLSAGWKWVSQKNWFQPSDPSWTINSVNIINPLISTRNICSSLPMWLLFMRSSPHALPILQGTGSNGISSHQAWVPQFTVMAAVFRFYLCLFFFLNHFLHVQYFFHFLCWFLCYSQRPAYASFSLYLCTCPSLFPSLSVPRGRSNTVPGCWMNEQLTVTDIHMLFQFFLPNLKQRKHFAHKRTLYSIAFVFSPLICNFLLLGP